MAKPAEMSGRLILPARIRSRRKTPRAFSTRMALIDQIADLPGIETVERNDETMPGRVEIHLKHDSSGRVLERKQAQLLCGLDCNAIFLHGLDRWERYQVLVKGWGKLVDQEVCIYLPCDDKELKIVWDIVRRAYDRLTGSLTPATESMVISTRDWPRVSRTNLQ